MSRGLGPTQSKILTLVAPGARGFTVAELAEALDLGERRVRDAVGALARRRLILATWEEIGRSSTDRPVFGWLVWSVLRGEWRRKELEDEQWREMTARRWASRFAEDQTFNARILAARQAEMARPCCPTCGQEVPNYAALDLTPQRKSATARCFTRRDGSSMDS